MRALGVFLLVVGCGSSAEAPVPPPPPVPPPVVTPDPPPTLPLPVTPEPAVSALDGDIEWRLDASATLLEMEDRADWELRTFATNRGTEPVDVLDSGVASFTVNGEPSMTLAMAFSNGISPTSWEALPPGGTADPARSGFGEELFPEPGTYEIVMTHGNAVVGIEIEVVGAMPALDEAEDEEMEDPTETPASGASARDGDVEWQLRASAATITMAEREAWVLRVVATNRGRTPLDYVAISSMSFTVNGESSMGLDMAFGNGGFPGSWRSLPTGASADPSREGIGLDIFASPGDYTIEMTTTGGVTVRLVVHVTP